MNRRVIRLIIILIRNHHLFHLLLLIVFVCCSAYSRKMDLQVLRVDYVSANDDGGVTTDHNQTCWTALCFTSNGPA
jgi:hypothetical protein